MELCFPGPTCCKRSKQSTRLKAEIFALNPCAMLAESIKFVQTETTCSLLSANN